MVMSLYDKKKIVSMIRDVADSALSAVVADARGVKSNDMNILRKLSRESGVRLCVIRNSLAKRAFSGTNYECLSDDFSGPSIVAFSNNHPGAGARIFKKMAESNINFQIKAFSFEGCYMKFDQIDKLALLPTYDEAVSKLMSVMEGATVKLVRTLFAINHAKKEGTV